MSSRRVNVIEFENENDFRPIYSDMYTTIGVGPITNINPFPPRPPRIAPRVVTPERRRPQFVPVYSEDLYDGSHFVHIIGVFDTQIAACHATIKWLIENEKGFDPESNAWETDYSPEEAIQYLCGLVTQWRELKVIADRFSDKFENELQGWFIKLQRFN